MTLLIYYVTIVIMKTSNNTKAKSLNVYLEKYNPKYVIRVSSKNFGMTNNIKSVLLYAVFCKRVEVI
ncbi:MAG: hypothetical protein ACI4XR_04240 [Bacilli bacterium]